MLTNIAIVRRPIFWIATVIVALMAGGALWWFARKEPVEVSPQAVVVPEPAEVQSSGADGPVTNIYAHNLRLHQGPAFRVYVQWLRGQLTPSHKGFHPTFDDPESFYLNVTNGVIRANIGDICNYLNARLSKGALKDLQMSGTGDQVKISGKFHKVFTIPVELTGVMTSDGGSRIRMHITKINLLKLPFKRLLGDFHVTVSSFLRSGQVAGIEVVGNDIFFNTEILLPAPHIRGRLTKVLVATPDLEAVYGNVEQDVERVEEWRNFLQLRGGVLNFGKLTMDPTDLMMIDISKDAWFDLDLANYQAQLVRGYSRMTPQAGLQIFMPDVSNVKPESAQQINIEWFKHRNITPPPSVLPQKRE